MKKILIEIIIQLLSMLPLCVIRGIGCLVGDISLKFSKRSAARLRKNLLITGLANPSNIDEMVRKTAHAQGMTLVEALLIAWRKDRKYIESLCNVDQDSFNLVNDALARGERILFFTPHIGNFELALKYYLYNLPLDIKFLYKPSKNPIINQIMLDGRKESNASPEPTNSKGVRTLMKHFQDGGDIGILPDNVAAGGSGDWLKFFGQDVYATTLAAKIYQQYKPMTIIMQSIRTKKGFDMKFIQFKPTSDDTHTLMQELYNTLEKMVLEAPEQYYWSYDRFRNVDNASPRPQAN
jgi:KDO2-lipid IV(A) lauroyltransferase